MNIGNTINITYITCEKCGGLFDYDVEPNLIKHYKTESWEYEKKLCQCPYCKQKWIINIDDDDYEIMEEYKK